MGSLKEGRKGVEDLELLQPWQDRDENGCIEQKNLRHLQDKQ